MHPTGHLAGGAFAPYKRFRPRRKPWRRVNSLRPSILISQGIQKNNHTFRCGCFFGASDEARTRYLHLGKVALYQMSYTRNSRVYNSRFSPHCQHLFLFLLFYFWTDRFQLRRFYQVLMQTDKYDKMNKTINLNSKGRCFAMKKTTGYLLVSLLNFIAGFCFLLAFVFQEEALPKYGFLIAAICLFISAAGFLYTCNKSK